MCAPRIHVGAALGPLLALLALGCGAPPEPANVVLILADDLGYGDLAPEAPARTPHLDRLAAEGVRLRDFHASGVVCTPTRGALLTGRYPERSGTHVLSHRPGMGLSPAEVTLAELLGDAGYATGLFGKWHLGHAERLHPLKHGFDVFVGHLTGWIDHQSHVRGHQIDWWHGEERVEEPGYASDLTTRHAVAFIDANAARPFFAFVSYDTPHGPLQGRYDPAEAAPAGFSPEDQRRFLERVNARIPEPPPGYEPRDRYVEMIEVLDEGVGAIRAALERHGVAERTFVFFHSDNGPAPLDVASAGPLRGVKREVFEGGHRVPAIAWGPGLVTGGRTSDATAASMDLFPTALALAGVEPPDDLALDGVDLGPLLRGEAELPERTLFWRHQAPRRGPARAARRGPWKLVWRGSERLLFDLERDLGEQRDLAGRHPERVEALLAEIAAWETDVLGRPPRGLRRRQPGGG